MSVDTFLVTVTTLAVEASDRILTHLRARTWRLDALVDVTTRTTVVLECEAHVTCAVETRQCVDAFVLARVRVTLVYDYVGVYTNDVTKTTTKQLL